MPIYEFQCENCNHCFEKLVFGNETKGMKCPECNNIKVKKLMSSACIGSSGSLKCSPGSTPGGFS